MNKRIKITGKVQGVFYRKSAQHKALELGVTGWIKNEPDGSVTAELEGEPHSVSAMESWLKKGPPQANVVEIKGEEGEEQDYTGFLIIE
jgi:acylphosphatase